MAKKILRRTGYALAGLIALLLVTLGAAWAVSSARLARTHDVSPERLDVRDDAATVARGRHLARAIAKCVDCHGDDLGGKMLIDDPRLARLSAPNLTTGAGGVGGRLTPEAIELAVRHGVRADGTPLLLMPAADYHPLGDADVAAIAAYVRQLPPVDRVLAPTELRIVGRALLTAGVLPGLAADAIDHRRPHTPPPAPGPTAQYGKHLVGVGACAACHGPTLSGGPEPGAPAHMKPPSNLTPAGIGHYTEADFVRALREGVRPGGAPIDSAMPWRYTKEMTDDEIRAVYRYLKTVPPRPFGNR